MKQRPLHILTLVSAVICVGSLPLVGRSFFRADELAVPIGQKHALGYDVGWPVAA